MKSISFVLSPSKFYCSILTSLIEKEVGIQCSLMHNTKFDSELEKFSSSEIGNVLLLLDYAAFDEQEVWNSVVKLKQSYNYSYPLYIMLFNAKRDLSVEINALTNGLVGVLFEDESVELMLKSVHKVLQGELWFSREALGKYFKRSICNLSEDYDYKEDINLYDLTKREKEVLVLIAEGNTNETIASNLSISASTVKTHIYNAFKKINVTNRIQATKWAIENLVRMES